MTLRRVELLVPHTRDVAEWARRHRSGEVPGRIFYSLEGLSEFGYKVVPRAGSKSVAARAASRLAGGFDWLSAVPARSDADVVVCWTETAGVPAALRSSRPPVATGVIWLTDRKLRRPLADLAGRGLRSADAVWALSRAQLPVLRDEVGIRPDRLHYLPFGIDSDFWSAAHSSNDTDPDLVVAVGNDRHRDYPSLLAAFRAVRRRLPSARLEMATAARLDLGDAETQHPLLPHVQLRDLYARAAVVVVALQPNLHVSGMTVALEAAAMGKPVVMTATGGASDYVDHDVSGVLVQAGDVDALARAVESILRDGPAAVTMGRHGRTLVEQHHSAATQARAMAEILGGL